MRISRISLRRKWFQIHKWIGLALAAVIIPLCLSGSALVWHDWVDARLNPERQAFNKHASDPEPLARYVESARAALGEGKTITAISVPAGEAVTVTAVVLPRAGEKGRPQRETLWLDPQTGAVLDRQGGNDGFTRVMHVLHGSLFIPDVGRTMVGWIGIAMLVSSISGLWLWWPITGSWRRGLRWKRQQSLDGNLHHMMGFWIAIPLFILSFTGAWISFPSFFGTFSGVSQSQRPNDASARARMMPVAQARLTPDQAVTAARPLMGSARLTGITWPTAGQPWWTVSYGTMARTERLTVTDSDRSVRPAPEATPAGGNSLARTMRRIHDGEGMGIVWQIVIFLGGILPTALAVTGVIMWLRTRGWRRSVADQRKATAS